MEYLLTFQNTHYAVHSEKVLVEQTIPVAVMALPTSLGDFCGICLRLEEKDFIEGRRHLLQAGLPIEGIFIIENQGEGRSYRPWKN
ncbi:DUF3343 domain-containing protein [Enterococcus termitis]|jgi:hypothetical protein|uniref:Putative Se/S carrier protein-like domain-containing protein n=1 Tax=Enterococcus termitis TaxID=332950 RepID=A0A1E5GI14_9ENTE|nr:DUF3343 domain-containing protein [Enterococcus termitis]OEG12366.1 hypothetical protein BCR25_07455 [Enterococcus termitis]OJG98803.1 hypothetical protein RV18_GL002665 [Enterococcus termitis]